MDDIERVHAEKLTLLIRGFQEKSAEILTSSAKMIGEALTELNNAHAQFNMDMGILNASIETQANSRMESTKRMLEELLLHYRGVEVEGKIKLPNVNDLTAISGDSHESKNQADDESSSTRKDAE